MPSCYRAVIRPLPLLLTFALPAVLLATAPARAAEVTFDPGSYPYSFNTQTYNDSTGTASVVAGAGVGNTNAALLSVPPPTNGPTTDGLAKVVINGDFGTLANFVGTFQADVTAGDQFPYMYVGVDVNHDGVFDSSLSTDAYVIVFQTPSGVITGTYYTDGFNQSDQVQVVGSTPGVTGCTSTDGGCALSTLEGDTVSAGVDWGDLEVLQVDVGFGESNTNEMITADIDNINVPEPASVALLGGALLAFGTIRRRRRN